jgi:hypothetical protein
LCPISKTFEQIIHDKLVRHFESNNILPSCQHGFRHNHSVTTQLLTVIDDLSLAIQNNQCADIIYFDLKKAFDSVPHSRLIQKLSRYGVKGPLLTLLTAYLSNRTFSVKVNNHLSSQKEVSSGVPQGSILGPLLFIAYIADLPDFCSTPDVTLKLFADDLKAYHIAKPSATFHVPLQTFIAKLTQYCAINCLEIAVQKCSTLHIGPRNPNHDYSLANSLIPNIPKGESVRDLGVYFTNDLKWHAHIEIIVTKARRTAFALLRSLKSNNPKFLLNMFKTYVVPILEFACPIFNPYYQKDIESIEKVQRDFVKSVYHRCPKYLKIQLFPDQKLFIDIFEPSYPSLLSAFGLETLELRRLKICLNLFHQCAFGHVPVTTQSFKVVASRTRGTTHKIITAPATKDVRHNSFFVRYARMYNELGFINTSQDDFYSLLHKTGFSKFLHFSV